MFYQYLCRNIKEIAVCNQYLFWYRKEIAVKKFEQISMGDLSKLWKDFEET